MKTLFVTLSALLILSQSPVARAAYIGHHSGNAPVGCTINTPANSSSDNVDLTCNDGNGNTNIINNTLTFNTVNGGYSRLVQYFPRTLVSFTDTIINNTGNAWTQLEYIFEANANGFVSNSVSISFQGSGSLFSMAFGLTFLDIFFDTPVVSGSGLTLTYQVDYSGRSGNDCGSCDILMTPGDEFEAPDLPVPNPGAWMLLGFGFLAVCMRQRAIRT